MGGGVWFAPGRANLMGEHVDYNGGHVLPFALAQGVTAAASPRPDGLLVLRSKQVPDEPATIALDSLEPGSVTGWAAYPAGVAWALQKAGYPVRGASVDIDSDLPVGAGVSSSAALECAVALALCGVSGISGVPRKELALLAHLAENDFVGAPTGIIDQSAALLCRAGHAMLLDCGTRTAMHVPFRAPSDGVLTLVADTRVAHSLVSGEFAQRRAECEAATAALGVPSLGGLTDAGMADAIADPVLRRRARHVITDSARARAIASALGEPASATRGGSGGARVRSDNVYALIGGLISESHRSLRDDLEVSWPEADVAVEIAEAAGAYGARMLGGGFGGSVLALVPCGRAAAVRAALTAEFAARSWAPPEFLDAIPSAAARQIG